MALVGLYVRQVGSAGRFGLVAFLTALVGTATMVGSDWTEFYLTPTFVKVAPHLMDNPPTLLIVGFTLNFAVYAIGWMLFGASLIRARVYPRPAAIALIVGMLLFPVSHHVGLLVWEATVIWLGASAVRGERRTETGRSIPATEQAGSAAAASA